MTRSEFWFYIRQEWTGSNCISNSRSGSVVVSNSSQVKSFLFPAQFHGRLTFEFLKSRFFRIDPMDNQATYTLKHMYTGQRDHHKNIVIQYDADGKSCDQCMGNKKKDVLELFIRGKIHTYYDVS